MKYNILIGGAAGQGIETISFILEKILLRDGYEIFSNKDYMSRVRGGHNFTQIRFSKNTLLSHTNKIDVIVALNEETIDMHIDNLVSDGLIIADESVKCNDSRFRSYPLNRIAEEVNNKRAENIVALGVLMKSFDIDKSPLDNILKETFEKFYDSNIEAFTKGYELAEVYKKVEDAKKSENILINGNDAFALGAIAGGLSFYAGYPMTPSTGVISYLVEKKHETGVFFEQAEDEIAAINMSLGASYAGARSMTGSSGGGLSLMTESLGLVGMMETPLVVIDVQRPGPATGLPTRTEQSDLSYLLTASHGEIPRMVISLKNPKDAFYQASRALNLADKYQLLVIILSDQFLADSKITTEPFDFSKITIERHIASAEDITDDIYKRYELTENGISKRLIPGKVKGQIVITDSDEHTEYGHITESSEVRVNMMNKRMNKLKLLECEMIEPEYYGNENIEHLLIGWGSTEGIIRDAVDILKEEGIKVGALNFGDIYPLPTKNLEKYTKDIKNIVNVEQNYTGQLAKLIRQETGIYCNKSILKYDGRQITAEEIVEQFKGDVINA